MPHISLLKVLPVNVIVAQSFERAISFSVQHQSVTAKLATKLKLMQPFLFVVLSFSFSPSKVSIVDVLQYYLSYR